MNFIKIKIKNDIVLISKESLWIRDVFPNWRIVKARESYKRVYCVRWIKTEYGVAREEYTLQRLVLGKKTSYTIDHINRNPLDNRISNLRYATRFDQAANTGKRLGINATSQYRGVCWRGNKSKTNSWEACISPKNKRYRLGYFPTEHHAAIAYNIAAKIFYKDFAFENKIPKKFKNTFKPTPKLSALLGMQKI
jgi:hypothetical protein